MFRSFSDNVNSFNNYQITIADDRSGLLTWLSPLEPQIRHQDIRGSRVENVGDWLLRTDEFRSWCGGAREEKSDNATLFYYGDPGVGKTYLSSLVVDTLCDRARGQNVAVACFYFDFALRKEQTPTSVLGALLKQVVGGLENMPGDIAEVFQDQKKVIGGRGLRLPEIVKLLQTSSSSQRTFICIDALDECVPEHRVKILSSLRKILQKSPNTRIYLTGRPHIRDEIEKRLAGTVVAVPISLIRDDIITYLRARLEEDTMPEVMDDSLEAGIVEKIPEKVSEIFLLASLHIDAILRETTIHRRRQKLSAMTDGLRLEDVYGATLKRIKDQGGEKSRLGIAALMWICHSERPLQVDELCHALAVEIGSTDFYLDNVPLMGTVLACCQGLVSVDKEASTVRLIHLTLQEYLSTHPDLFGSAHSTMAETCLTYLNSPQVKDLPYNVIPNPRDTPFLEYSSKHWGAHAKSRLSDCAKSLALDLFGQYGGHISVKLLFGQPWYHEDSSDLLLFTGLHCACFFGIVELVAALMGMESCDINRGDFLGNTPLIWAARNGHEGVVELLLGCKDINPNIPDQWGRTPLLWAASSGHEGAVRLLVAREDVDPDEPDSDSQTPLLSAAMNRHEGVVKLLLAREDLNPEKADRGGQTPLLWAAFSGHDGVVKLLLEREGVNLDRPDRQGRTPLLLAAKFGNEEVVKLLLEREGVNPEKLDSDGQTPLLEAARFGLEGVVKLLLAREDVNPNQPDREGQTPLLTAVMFEHEGVVKLLLGREDVDPEKPDREGLTPLLCAAKCGCEGVVKLLLERECVSPDKRDRYGQTPLLAAAAAGHEGVVRLLLAREDAKPDTLDDSGRTSLMLASRLGHEGVVKLLLARGDVDPTKPDQRGRTALSYAITFRHESVVELLQAHT